MTVVTRKYLARYKEGNMIIPVHLTSYFFPEYSGTATRLYNLLSRLPYKVSLITSDRMMSGMLIPQESEQINNIEVRRVPLYPQTRLASISAIRRLYTIYAYYQMLRKVIKVGEDKKFDVIHAHNTLPFGEAARKLAKIYHCPFVFELHAISEENLAGISKIIQKIYLEKETRRLTKYAHHVITLTHSQKERICRFYKIPKEKITVVPNGVDVDTFVSGKKYQKNAENLREKLGISGKIVMYAGIMDKINGLADLANVIPSIISEKTDTSFVFIGHGPEEDKIIALSKKYPQVKFLPMVHYDEMPVYYQMCDLFIIPRPSTISAETVTPLKLLEAMAMEKPVLGSNVGGIAEIIKHGENGYLYEKGNMESFKKTLLEVLDADNTQIGKNARKTVVDNYTWDKSAKILQRVYEDLA